MKIIPVLISGKQGSGKTSLAKAPENALANFGDIDQMSITFAAPLYEMHKAVLKIMNGYGIKTPIKDGPLLQLLGTEWGRNQYGDDIWVDIARNRIREEIRRIKSLATGLSVIEPKALVVIISDCRFTNEISDHNFPDAIKIRLHCPEEIRKERILSTPGQNWRENSNHPSEISLDNYNDWTLICPTHQNTTDKISTWVMDQIKNRL